MSYERRNKVLETELYFNLCLQINSPSFDGRDAISASVVLFINRRYIIFNMEKSSSYLGVSHGKSIF